MTHVPLGTYGPFYWRRQLRLDPAHAKTHWHLIGKSGSGKSRYLAHLFLSFLRAGLPVSLIDPHGDLARLILGHLIESGLYDDPGAFERVLYLDLPAAEREERYLPFNLLRQALPEHTIAAQFKEAMHRAFPELAEGAATFDTLLPRSLRVLLYHQLPLTQLERFFLDTSFRNQLLATYPDENTLMFFHNAYEEMRKPDQLTYAGSVLRRAALLTDLPILRYSFGQDSNSIPFRQIIDAGRSMIINLALREDEAMKLLGSLITVGFEMAAKGRSELLDFQRTHSHHLIIDEFPSFTARSEEAMTTMLSQTRKYGLFLILAHQNWSQASEKLRGSLGNVGIEVAFRLEREDALQSARILGRVDPRSLRETLSTVEAESVGMQEQWEVWIQGLQDLHRRMAFIRKERLPLPWPWRLRWHRPPTHVYKVKTPPVPDTKAPLQSLIEVEKRYLELYFRPRAEIERQMRESSERRPVSTPLQRWSPVGKVG